MTCSDGDESRIDGLNGGHLPIHEPGLADLVASNVIQGPLAFSTEMKPAIKSADVVFIAVGTPWRRGDGYADLSYVWAAAREIAHALSGYTAVSDKVDRARRNWRRADHPRREPAR